MLVVMEFIWTQTIAQRIIDDDKHDKYANSAELKPLNAKLFLIRTRDMPRHLGLSRQADAQSLDL